MSWTQGVQQAEDLPEWFRNLAVRVNQNDPELHFAYIVWDDLNDPNVVFLEYLDDAGQYVKSIKLDLTPLLQQTTLQENAGDGN